MPYIPPLAQVLIHHHHPLYGIDVAIDSDCFRCNLARSRGDVVECPTVLHRFVDDGFQFRALPRHIHMTPLGEFAGSTLSAAELIACKIFKCRTGIKNVKSFFAMN
jgi:hypothetical protein